jgi:hypothetical protein
MRCVSARVPSAPPSSCAFSTRGELWRRIESRDRERTQASRALTLGDVERWAAQIEPPDADELALYDPPLS